MSRSLDRYRDLIVSGTVENQVRFHHVDLLSAPLEVLPHRVTGRTNPYGRTPQQQAEIAHYVQTVEPLLRRGATIELDGRRRVSDLADTIEDLVRKGHQPAANGALPTSCPPEPDRSPQ